MPVNTVSVSDGWQCHIRNESLKQCQLGNFQLSRVNKGISKVVSNKEFSLFTITVYKIFFVARVAQNERGPSRGSWREKDEQNLLHMR